MQSPKDFVMQQGINKKKKRELLFMFAVWLQTLSSRLESEEIKCIHTNIHAARIPAGAIAMCGCITAEATEIVQQSMVTNSGLADCIRNV